MNKTSIQTIQNLSKTLKKHGKYYDNQCIVLEGATNVMNPKAVKFLSSHIGNRPSLGKIGQKYERGLHNLDEIEHTCTGLFKKLFNAKFCEIRPLSGSQAVLIALMTLSKPGDSIFSLNYFAAGHPTHRPDGEAGLYGLDVHDIPFNLDGDHDVSIDALEKKILGMKKTPKLILIGSSLPLFPHNVQEIRKLADKYGIYVLYDASHSSGMIAGEQYQIPSPLECGAHIMISSTYKSLGGPAGGFLLTNDEQLAQKIDVITYPGITANFHMNRYPSLIVTCLDWMDYGQEYASNCVLNAQTLAQELDNQGVEVYSRKNGPGNKYTHSHLICLRSTKQGGEKDSFLLEKANILTSDMNLPDQEISGLRIGVQEMTKRGMKTQDMKTLANFMSQVLLGKSKPSLVKKQVVEFRKSFKDIHYITKYQ